MPPTIKAHWQNLQAAPPGRRFRQQFERSAAHGGHQGWRRVLRVGLAIVAIVIGVVLVFIPGPAVVFFVIAAALLAMESRTMAGMLDVAELKARAVGRWSQEHWRRLPRVAQVAIAIVAVAGAGWLMFSFYRFVRG